MGIPLSQEELARGVRWLRQRIGYDSVTAMAKSLGAYQSNASKWENPDSKRGIPEKHLRTLLEEAGMTYAEFIGRMEGAADYERGEMLVAAEWMERMAEELRERANLPPESRSDPESIADAAERAMEKRRKRLGGEEQTGA